MPLSRIAAPRLILLALVLPLSSCYHKEMKRLFGQVDSMQQQIDDIRRSMKRRSHDGWGRRASKGDDQTDELLDMEERLDKIQSDVASVSSILLCRRDARVRDFINGCRMRHEGCSSTNFEDNLKYMTQNSDSVKHVLAYLPYQDPLDIKQMSPTKLGRIVAKIQDHPVSPSTVFFIVAMPAGGLEKNQNSSQIAWSAGMKLRSLLLDSAPKLKSIATPEPVTVGCTDITANLAKTYARQNKDDQPYSSKHPDFKAKKGGKGKPPEEPDDDQPHIALWAFLVDC